MKLILFVCLQAMKKKNEIGCSSESFEVIFILTHPFLHCSARLAK